MRLTKHDIIQETVEHYLQAPRATISGIGVYKTPEGILGPHARALSIESLRSVVHQGKIFESALMTHSMVSYKSGYQGHEAQFWKDLQDFHDDPDEEIWGKNGLTSKGKSILAEIKKKWKR